MGVWSSLKSLFGASAQKQAASVTPAPSESTPRNDFAAVVDCSADPYDLRPAADAIIQQIEARLAKLKPDETLYLFYGEFHPIEQHPLLLQLFMQRLKGKGISFEVSGELPHDIISKYISNEELPRHHFRTSDAVMKAVEEHDPDGALLISLSLTRISPEAPLARDSLAMFMLENGVPYRTNDLSMISPPNGLHTPQDLADNIILDMNEYRTLQHVRASKLPDDTIIEATSDIGMILRNVFFLNRTYQQAARARPRVMIAHVGQRHALDDEDYARSMHFLTQNAGLPAMSVVFDLSGMRSAFESLEMPLKDVVMITKLAADGFSWRYKPNMKFKKGTPLEETVDVYSVAVFADRPLERTLSCPEAERGIAEKTINHSGHELQLLIAAPVRKTIYDELREIMPDVIDVALKAARTATKNDSEALPNPMKW